MPSAHREGVIKFALDFTPGAAPAAGLLHELDAWRAIFVALGLLGQDTRRYAGLGFGNLSRRLPGRDGAFIISGTQTGDLPRLAPEHYATVTGCDPQANSLRATGPVKPSSEALSHGILYASTPHTDWVMHLHSPEIFSHAQTLGLPVTDPAIAYGTPRMAEAILQLARNCAAQHPQLLVMGGHQDGILAFGAKADAVGALVVATLAGALALA
jgi:hypothetical protein